MINLKQKLFFKINDIFNRWLKNRLPAASTQVLSNKNIFIFPTPFGFAYMAFILLLFLLGTNYQNNVIILLSYMMASLFVTCMLHSFFNLLGITFCIEGQDIAYAKQKHLILIKINANKPRFDLRFEFPVKYQLSSLNKNKNKNKDEDEDEAIVIHSHYSTVASGDTEVFIPFTPAKRGLVFPGRVKISSEYSLGFFRTWTQLDFGNQITVAPTPLAITGTMPKLTGVDEGDDSSTNPVKGTDDFSELKTYVAGEPLTHVAWKQIARGLGWLTKK